MRDIQLADDPYILKFFQEQWATYDGTDVALSEIVTSVLGFEKLWEQNLNDIPNLKEEMTKYLVDIERNGMKTALLGENIEYRGGINAGGHFDS